MSAASTPRLAPLSLRFASFVASYPTAIFGCPTYPPCSCRSTRRLIWISLPTKRSYSSIATTMMTAWPCFSMKTGLARAASSNRLARDISQSPPTVASWPFLEQSATALRPTGQFGLNKRAHWSGALRALARGISVGRLVEAIRGAEPTSCSPMSVERPSITDGTFLRQDRSGICFVRRAQTRTRFA